MKKIFFLCLAVCLLGLASCSSNDSSSNDNSKNNDSTGGKATTESQKNTMSEAPAVTGSTAFVDMMKVLDKFEAGVNKSKSCDELFEASTELLMDALELAEKYPDDNKFSESEQNKIQVRMKKLDKLSQAKAKQLNCNFDDMDFDDMDEDDWDLE